MSQPFPTLEPASPPTLPRDVQVLGGTSLLNDMGTERKGLAYGSYNFAIGIATLPASLIFGALYQVYGALAAFGWGAALALVAVVLLTFVGEARKTGDAVK